MYEITISIAKEHQYILDFVKDNLSHCIDDTNSIQVQLNGTKRSYLSLACNETFKKQLMQEIVHFVSLALSCGYKNIFVRSLFNKQSYSFCQNVLVDTLCVFDSHSDVCDISRLIDADKDIYLDGYYNFLMSKIKAKWTKIVKMIVDNDYVLSDDKFVLEFLQYLVDSADSRLKIMSISFDNTDYCLFDDQNKSIPKLQTLSQVKDCFVESLVNAICLCPKQLKIYHQNPLPMHFCNLAQRLFEVKFVPTI